MLEHFTTSDETFHYKLGSTLTMEKDALELLGEEEKNATRSDLGELFQGKRRKLDRTLKTCESVLLGWVSKPPSPSVATTGLVTETMAFVTKTDSTHLDSVILPTGIL